MLMVARRNAGLEILGTAGVSDRRNKEKGAEGIRAFSLSG
jgi:hypothetical protein